MCIAAPFWFWKKLSHGKKNINSYQFELSIQSSGCISKLSLFYWSSGLLLYKHLSSVLCWTKFSFNLQAHVWNKIAPPTSRNLRQEHTANPIVRNPFFPCKQCLLNFYLIFVKRQSKIESESCNASINNIKKCANLVFIIWSYLRTKEINLQLIQLVNFRTSGLKTLISDQLHNSCKGLQLLFVVVVVLWSLSDHSFCFAN